MLPVGYVVQLNQRTRVRDDGSTLVGGSPTRVMFLKPEARRLLRDGMLNVTDVRTAAFAERLLETGIADPVVERLPQADVSQVTYIVPVRDRADELDRLLGSIQRGSTVLVVDDASARPEDTIAIAERHSALTVLLPSNVGAAAARNAGLARASTRFVAFVDSDVVLTPDCIPLLLRHFADPKVALVAPRVLGLPAVSGETWINRYEDARSSLDLGQHPGIVKPRSKVSWLSGTAILARVDALGAGFTPHMRSGEDVDLVWRLVEEGYRVRYEPAVHVFHEHRSTVNAWMRRKAFYGTGALQLGLRHPSNIAPAVLAPWSAAMLLALLPQRRWSIPVALGIAGVSWFRISAKISSSAAPRRLAAELTLTGVGAALVQGMALLLRHWWPLSVAVAIFSPRVRRALVASAIADTVLEYARTRPRLDPVRYGVARRLDDMAYGAGVWWSALTGRSMRALIPDFTGSFGGDPARHAPSQAWLGLPQRSGHARSARSPG